MPIFILLEFPSYISDISYAIQACSAAHGDSINQSIQATIAIGQGQIALQVTKWPQFECYSKLLGT